MMLTRFVYIYRLSVSQQTAGNQRTILYFSGFVRPGSSRPILVLIHIGCRENSGNDQFGKYAGLDAPKLGVTIASGIAEEPNSGLRG